MLPQAFNVLELQMEKKKKKEKMGHLILKEVHQRVEVALDVQFVQS